MWKFFKKVKIGSFVGFWESGIDYFEEGWVELKEGLKKGEIWVWK